MPLVTHSKVVDYGALAGAAQARRATFGLFAGLGCMAAIAPASAENWRFSASASATETYTTNVDYVSKSLAEGAFATSVTGALKVNGEGARLKLNGSIGATATVYTGHSEDNSFAPQVSMTGTLEAIEKFAYLDAQAFIGQTFQFPFGAQPSSLVNATPNRYTQQNYVVSPYIKGVFPSSGVSYQVRDDNYWTLASNYGDASTSVPNTYSNNFSALMESPVSPWGWTLAYNRSYYDNGLTNRFGNVGNVDIVDTPTTYNSFLGTLVYQIDPQLRVSLRGGYDSYKFAAPTTESARYGIGIQWSPTERTQVVGFWDHTFFGSSYSLQVSHRLPNAALSATVSRGISSYPEVALAIPAGASVSQFLNAAFATRIFDPAERARAVDQFLARTQLAPTLASPVSFYATSLTLQEQANLSLVLIGTRNTVGLSAFYLKTEAVSGQGNVLPSALQFGQHNTQIGAGITYSLILSSMTNLGAGATYSTTTVDTTTGPLANTRSKNLNTNVSLNTRFGPRTTGSAGVTYSWSDIPGSSITGGSIAALNAYVTVSYTF